MKTLQDYKKQARAIAKRDTAQGFRFHVMRRPFSDAICTLTGQMIADGFSLREMDETFRAWETSLTLSYCTRN